WPQRQRPERLIEVVLGTGLVGKLVLHTAPRMHLARRREQADEKGAAAAGGDCEQGRQQCARIAVGMSRSRLHRMNPLADIRGCRAHRDDAATEKWCDPTYEPRHRAEGD